MTPARKTTPQPDDATAPLPADFAAAVADVMQGLSSPARVQILDRLHRSPCSVGELAETLGLGQPTVSNHLRLLRHLDLVRGRRDGRSVVYELHDEHVAALLRQVLAHVRHAEGA